MNKNIYLFLTFITLLSCKDNSKDIEALKQENLRLQNEIVQKNTPKSKYVWTLIHCKTGTFTKWIGESKGHFESIQNTLYWSDINEISNFNNDIKYKLEDDLENKCRRRYGQALHSIQKRETYVFDTYQEASEYKYSIINKK